MDSATRLAGYREALLQLVERASKQTPLVIRVEDVHWADEGLLEHLAALASLAGASRVVLVLTSRIESDPMEGAWRAAMRRSPLTTLDLVPLCPEEARELARIYVDDQSEFAVSCIQRTEGNPLFLDQLLRSAQDATADIPGSIQSVVLTRMDRLAPRDKVAVQAAAVIGQRFSVDALRHLVDDSAYECATLVEHMLVQPMGAVRGARARLPLLRRGLPARHLRQHEDGGEHGVRGQEAGLQPPLPGDVFAPSGGACGVHARGWLGEGAGREAPPATIPTPEGLQLRHQPVADCQRYDSLREAGHGAS